MNTLPLQMASLGIIHTERPTVLVPHSDSAKPSQRERNFFLQRSYNFLLTDVFHLGGTVNSWFVIISNHLLILLTHLSSSLKCDSQWKPFIQDVQAQEEYPRGISPVRVVETCRGYSGKWEPAHGSHVARG